MSPLLSAPPGPSEAGFDSYSIHRKSGIQSNSRTLPFDYQTVGFCWHFYFLTRLQRLPPISSRLHLLITLSIHIFLKGHFSFRFQSIIPPCRKQLLAKPLSRTSDLRTSLISRGGNALQIFGREVLIEHVISSSLLKGPDCFPS